jgi:hypothetical protein
MKKAKRPIKKPALPRMKRIQAENDQACLRGAIKFFENGGNDRK